MSASLSDNAISVELEEIQAPVHGRKFASIDRRPLDPPPIVQMRLFETARDPYTGQQTRMEIMEYSDYNLLGTVCLVDLVPSSPPDTAPSSSHTIHPPPAVLGGYPLSTQWDQYGAGVSSNILHGAAPHLSQLTMTGADYGYSTPTSARGNDSHYSPDMALNAWAPHNAAFLPMQQAVAHDYPVYNTPEVPQYTSQYLLPQPTPELQRPSPAPQPAPEPPGTSPNDMFGTKVTQAMRLSRKDEVMLVFVFGDLAVRREGYFRLRYKVFDVLSGGNPQGEHALIAMTEGETFRIWPSKEFPGLAASTELTKLVASQGASVHLRQRSPSRKREVC